MDFCKHPEVNEEICIECGMRVSYSNYYEQSYTPNNNINITPKASFYKKLASLGIKKSLIMEGGKCLDKLAQAKINLKGNRKKAIIIIHSFAQDKTIDICNVINSVGLKKSVINNTIVLYEKYISIIDYGIKEIAQKYFAVRNIEITEDIFRDIFLPFSILNSKQDIYSILNDYGRRNLLKSYENDE